MVMEDGREGFGKIFDTFLSAQSTDIADESWSIGQWYCCAEGIEIKEMMVCDENLLTIFIKVPFRYKFGRIEDDFGR
ncbi:MAG: hypothetical protein ACOX7H_08390 [Bacillota bacterium]